MLGLNPVESSLAFMILLGIVAVFLIGYWVNRDARA